MLFSDAESEGVAWWAHIGGFVFGLVAGIYLNSYVKQTIDYDSSNNDRFL